MNFKMKPYKNIKLEEFPDVADIQFEARKSSVGSLRRKSGEFRGIVKNKLNKKQQRRYWKRRNRQLEQEIELLEENALEIMEE